jgi:hypothetical protein
MTNWSGDMADVADICGNDVARELCEQLPGIRLYVPAELSESNPLTRIDLAIAERLIAMLPGSELYIPSRRKSSQETLAAIEALLDRGLSTQDIALELDITQAYIFKLRREKGVPKIAHRPDPRQLPLFE